MARTRLMHIRPVSPVAQQRPDLPLSECVVLPAKLAREWAAGGRMRREKRDDRAWVGGVMNVVRRTAVQTVG